MSTKKPKRRCFPYHFLILCFFMFCLSACISGEIICEKCESGKIAVFVFERTTGQLIATEIFDCGPYFIQVPSSYIGKQVSLIANRDEDGDKANSIGDCFGYYPELDDGWRAPSFSLQLINNDCDITTKHEITATIAGEVTCDEYTSGSASVWALDGPYDPEWTAKKISEGPSVTMVWNEGKNTYSGNYLQYVFDTPIGSNVWVMGQWHRPDGGYCLGQYPDPIELEEVNTDIDFDICQDCP